MASLFYKVQHHLKNFQGIGSKLAERMTFELLDLPKEEVYALADVLIEFKNNIKICSICGLVSEQIPCKICVSKNRDRTILCVVKNVADAFTLERSGVFNGLYHVLGGLLSPIANFNKKDLHIEKILKRLEGVKEVLFAMEQNIEAEATIKSISDQLRKYPLRLSRMGIGIPAGTGLEHIDEDTLSRSIEHRVPV